jgi:hypothetical protein
VKGHRVAISNKVKVKVKVVCKLGLEMAFRCNGRLPPTAVRMNHEPLSPSDGTSWSWYNAMAGKEIIFASKDGFIFHWMINCERLFCTDILFLMVIYHSECQMIDRQCQGPFILSEMIRKGIPRLFCLRSKCGFHCKEITVIFTFFCFGSPASRFCNSKNRKAVTITSVINGS